MAAILVPMPRNLLLESTKAIPSKRVILPERALLFPLNSPLLIHTGTWSWAGQSVPLAYLSNEETETRNGETAATTAISDRVSGWSDRTATSRRTRTRDMMGWGDISSQSPYNTIWSIPDTLDIHPSSTLHTQLLPILGCFAGCTRTLLCSNSKCHSVRSAAREFLSLYCS